MVVVGEAADGREGIELACRLVPEVVVMDLRMPIMDGIEATRQLTCMLPQARVVISAAQDYPALWERAAQAGAVAVVVKDGPPSVLLTAVRDAWSGMPARATPAAAIEGMAAPVCWSR